jgi:curved DNA-binding protein CbpA
MDFELPPDPYAALGVAKTASSAEIKKAWQRLVLKCHPDKVADEAAKLKANDEFHQVQSAYKLIGEDASRERYNAQVRIHELRKQNEHLRNQAHPPRFDVRTASFDSRTAGPPKASYAPRAPPRYEERRPSYFDDDDPPRASARKYPEYSYVKQRRAPSKDRDRERERERERVRTSGAEERRKAERKRDVEEKELRARKQFETRQQEEFIQQYEEDRRRRDREEADRKKAAEAPRPTLQREDTLERIRLQEERIRSQEEEARRHMQSQERPEFYRTTSSRDVPQYTYVRRSAGEPKDSRRARETESPRGSPPRGTASTRRSKDDIGFESRPATLKQQTSAPPMMTTFARESRDRDAPQPHRSYTTQTDYDRRKAENEPPISLPRANTMPTVPSASARKSQPSQPSKLRTSESAMIPDSGYSSPASPERQYASSSYPPPPPPAQPSTRTTTYVYSSGNTTSAPAPGVEYTNGHRVQVREPSSANTGARRVARSPSPLRDLKPASTTAQKMAHLATGSPRPRPTHYASAYPDSPASRPPMAQTASAREVPRSSRSPDRRDRRRDRDRYGDERAREKLYGETGPGQYRQPTSYKPEQISFSKRYTPDDVIYTNRQKGSQDPIYEERRPNLSRSSTVVC